MTKSELIESLADNQKISVREAKSIVTTILATMTEALLRGHNIEIRGFGSVQVRQYDPYVGRNPMTGQKINIGPKKIPFFKPGKDLREQMNKN